MSKGLSICIIAQNEEQIVEECLKQARKLADELVLVDSGSKDKTVEIAEKYCDRVEHHNWQGYAKQKNYAISLCTNDWVLSLDADEVIPDALIEEIKNLAIWTSDSIEYSPEGVPINGYKIARKLYVGDRFIRFGGYYPDYQLRLFRKELGRFAEAYVHESVELIDPRTGVHTKSFLDFVSTLDTPLDHHSYKNVKEMETAFLKYGKLFNKGLPSYEKSYLKAFLKSIFTFFYKFFIRLGFLHNGLGLKLAIIHSKYTFSKWNKSRK